MEALLVIAGACVIWAIVAGTLIAAELHKRGVPINFIWIRLYIFKYLHQYRMLTIVLPINLSI